MKILLFAACIAAAPSVALGADEKPKTETAPAPAAASASATVPASATAEELVETIDRELNASEEEDTPQDEKEIVASWQKRMASVDAAIAEFRKRFATHPLKWKVLFLEANAREIREELGLPIPKESRPAAEVYAEIANAPDADADTKKQASSARLISMADQVSEKPALLPEWEKQFDSHMKTHPAGEENAMLVELRLMLVEEHANARLIPLLEELAKSSAAEIADLAKNRLSMERTKAELKSKPVELKFTALDGREVDLEKLRGKVVLVDFWATWCGPCMVELPNVLKTYAKFKDKGLEVIGISLDEEEAELKRVVKAKGIAWPQYFDGKGWENPYAKKYGIDGIPAMWLVNKKGMVVDTEAQEGLAEKVEKLLAE